MTPQRMSVQERIAALPEMPKGTTQDFPDAGTSMTIWTAEQYERVQEGIRARLTLAAQAIGEYLTAHDQDLSDDALWDKWREAEVNLRAVLEAIR